MLGRYKRIHSNLFALSYRLLIVLLLGNCAKEDIPPSIIKLGGTYRIPITSEITSLDPISGELYSWTIGSQMYEGLLTYSRDESKIIPLLVERYEINGLSCIFYLQSGVRFHNDPCFPDGKGRELTADDIKYSFERSYKPGVGTARLREPIEAFLGFEEFLTGKSPHIEGLKVLDRYTFEIELTAPEPGLLSSLAGSGLFIVPEEAVDFYGEDFKLHPVGTGPFRFSEFIPNEKLILVKNENYWAFENSGHLPYLDRVEYILYLPGETEKMLLDFQTGKIDECTQDAADHIQDLVELDAGGNLKFKGWFKENGIQFVKDTVFRKLRYVQADGENRMVRQAMGYAINRERLVRSQTAIFHNYQVAKGPIPPGCQYFDEHTAGQVYDPTKARTLLKQAGYAEGKGLTDFLFLSRRGKEFDYIVEDLRAVGFRIRKSDFFPGWRKFLVSEDRGPLLLRMTNTNTAMEAYAVFGMFVGQPFCYEDTVFVNGVDAWQKNASSLTNKTLINHLEEIIADITPVVFLYHIDGEFRFLQKYVRGRQLGNAWGHKLHYVWLER